MPSERFFTEEPLKKSQTITLVEKEAHHLLNVTRIKVGETVEIVNGKGQLAKATLVNTTKKSAELSIKSVQEKSTDTRLILAQAIPRLNRLETILEKGTELGVTEFWLFPGYKSEKSEFSPSQLKRMQGIIISAMKQCGRLDLPQLIKKPPLIKWSKLPFPAVFGDLSTEAVSLKEVSVGKEIMAIIGPESGFTESEEKTLQNLGVVGVKLHWNILRTDTAAIAMLSQLALIKGIKY